MLRDFNNLSKDLVIRANYTSQSSSVSESASASEYSEDRKVPIGFCVSSYIYQSSSVIFADIHSHPNIIKLYPFCIRIRTSEGSLNGHNFLIYGSIFALKVSFFSALKAACSRVPVPKLLLNLVEKYSFKWMRKTNWLNWCN